VRHDPHPCRFAPRLGPLRGPSPRRAGEAHELTAVATADFSRIRNAKLGRFTIDRLMTILADLGQQVEVTVDVRPRCAALGGSRRGLR